jgi:acylphosphatase
VQGVWYRGSARAEARRLGLVGWARNRPDGSVEVLAEGPSERLEEFVEWCRRGPPAARVRTVIRHAATIGDKLVDFQIR